MWSHSHRFLRTGELKASFQGSPMVVMAVCGCTPACLTTSLTRFCLFPQDHSTQRAYWCKILHFVNDRVRSTLLNQPHLHRIRPVVKDLPTPHLPALPADHPSSSPRSTHQPRLQSALLSRCRITPHCKRLLRCLRGSQPYKASVPWQSPTRTPLPLLRKHSPQWKQ